MTGSRGRAPARALAGLRSPGLAAGLAAAVGALSGAAGCSRADRTADRAASEGAGGAPSGPTTPGAPAGAASVATPTAPSERPAPPRPAALTHVTIKALGMYCEESCPVRVRYALADLTSVYELGFDLSKESVFVSYDSTLGPAKQVTRPMLEAIKRAGFDPWLARESWPDDADVRVVAR